MGLKLYDEDDVQNIADAIRAKNGSSATYKVSDMATAIFALGSPVVTGEFTTSGSAGTQTINVDYGGSGHPLLLLVSVSGGIQGNSSYYSLNEKGAIATYSVTKASFATNPSYQSGYMSGDDAYYSVSYKGTTSGTSIVNAGAYGYDSYGDAVTNNMLTWTSDITFEISVTTSSVSTKHFPLSTSYTYTVLYSE